MVLAIFASIVLTASFMFAVGIVLHTLRPQSRLLEEKEAPVAEQEKSDACDHGVEFPEDLDGAVLDKLSAEEIREMWPRLDGTCPKGCGFRGIAYASYRHYIYGDW